MSLLPDVIYSFSVSSYGLSFFISWSTQKITFHDSSIHLFRPFCSCSLLKTACAASSQDTCWATDLHMKFQHHLFITIFELISLIIRVVMIKCYKHQCFVRAPSLGRLLSETEKLQGLMRYGYSPLDSNQVFICHERYHY